MQVFINFIDSFVPLNGNETATVTRNMLVDPYSALGPQLATLRCWLQACRASSFHSAQRSSLTFLTLLR